MQSFPFGCNGNWAPRRNTNAKELDFWLIRQSRWLYWLTEGSGRLSNRPNMKPLDRSLGQKGETFLNNNKVWHKWICILNNRRNNRRNVKYCTSWGLAFALRNILSHQHLVWRQVPILSPSRRGRDIWVHRGAGRYKWIGMGWDVAQCCCKWHGWNGYLWFGW